MDYTSFQLMIEQIKKDPTLQKAKLYDRACECLTFHLTQEQAKQLVTGLEQVDVNRNTFYGLPLYELILKKNISFKLPSHIIYNVLQKTDLDSLNITNDSTVMGLVFKLQKNRAITLDSDHFLNLMKKSNLNYYETQLQNTLVEDFLYSYPSLYLNFTKEQMMEALEKVDFRGRQITSVSGVSSSLAMFNQSLTEPFTLKEFEHLLKNSRYPLEALPIQNNLMFFCLYNMERVQKDIQENTAVFNQNKLCENLPHFHQHHRHMTIDRKTLEILHHLIERAAIKEELSPLLTKKLKIL